MIASECVSGIDIFDFAWSIFRCECVNGWSGSVCSVEPACLSQPCMHGGVCINSLGEQNTPTYSCSCANHWSGPTCNVTPACIAAIGYRQRTVTQYSHVWPSGDLVATNVSETISVPPCENNGTCVDALQPITQKPVFSCRCRPGWDSQFCTRTTSVTATVTLVREDPWPWPSS
jgi:hypothetical protein